MSCIVMINHSVQVPGPHEASGKGFTLIEIMVAVVIIALLASMAIPSLGRIRRHSQQTAMLNDGRAIGTAAQQYFMTTGKNSVEVVYDSVTGVVSGDLSPWLTGLTRNYTFVDNVVNSGSTNSFSFLLPNAFSGAPVVFTDEGRTTYKPEQ